MHAHIILTHSKNTAHTQLTGHAAVTPHSTQHTALNAQHSHKHTHTQTGDARARRPRPHILHVTQCYSTSTQNTRVCPHLPLPNASASAAPGTRHTRDNRRPYESERPAHGLVGTEARPALSGSALCARSARSARCSSLVSWVPLAGTRLSARATPGPLRRRWRHGHPSSSSASSHLCTWRRRRRSTGVPCTPPW